MSNHRVGRAIVVLLAVACSRTPERQADVGTRRPTLAGREWELVALGEQIDPVGAGRRRATMRFAEDDQRAGGFGGCNRWSASYSLADDSLTFGPTVSTKMACSEGMDLETAFFAMLAAARRYEATGSMLTLLANGAPVARFRAVAP